jgi:hypothetical protein
MSWLLVFIYRTAFILISIYFAGVGWHEAFGMNDTVTLTFKQHVVGGELQDSWDVVITDKDTTHAALWFPASKSIVMAPIKSTHGEVNFALKQRDEESDPPIAPSSRRLLEAQHGALRGSGSRHLPLGASV